MNTSVNPEPRRPLRTSDLAAAGAASTEVDEIRDEAHERRQSPAAQQKASTSAPTREAPTQGLRPEEQLEALFPADTAAGYRTRWGEVQSGFVDDPRQAVAKGDELVAEVMRSLAESFAHERARLEDELSHTGEASTEALRVGLRRYRSFFERLLSL
jgi:hypothetical protein